MSCILARCCLGRGPEYGPPEQVDTLLHTHVLDHLNYDRLTCIDFKYLRELPVQCRRIMYDSRMFFFCPFGHSIFCRSHMSMLGSESEIMLTIPLAVVLLRVQHVEPIKCLGKS